MKISISIVFIIHGFAHLVGFVVSWRISEIENMQYKTTILSGAIDIGDTGTRIVGILWLLSALSFLSAAIGIIVSLTWWIQLTFTAAVFSLLLCILGWPDSKIGVFVNVFILVFLIISEYFGWLS